MLRAALALVALLHIAAWTAYAIAISEAARYHYYKDVWLLWLLLGLGPTVLGVAGARLESRRAAKWYALVSAGSLLMLYGAFDAFYADVPDWALTVIPLTTLSGAILGMAGGIRFRRARPSRPAPDSAADGRATDDAQ